MKNLLRIAVVGSFLFGCMDRPLFYGPMGPWVFMPVAFAETSVIPKANNPVVDTPAKPTGDLQGSGSGLYI